MVKRIILIDSLSGLNFATVVEPRFNEVPRDWAYWLVISRVRYIENLVITNLLENNQSVCYIGEKLTINRTNKREKR